MNVFEIWETQRPWLGRLVDFPSSKGSLVGRSQPKSWDRLGYLSPRSTNVVVFRFHVGLFKSICTWSWVCQGVVACNVSLG